MKLIDQIEIERKKRYLSKARVAKLAGVDPADYCRMTNGKNNTGKTIDKLINGMGGAELVWDKK